MIIKYDWNNQGELKSFHKVANLLEIVIWLEQKHKENWYYNENGDYTSRITQIHILLDPEFGLWLLLYPSHCSFYLMAGDSRIATFNDIKDVTAFLKFLKGI